MAEKQFARSGNGPDIFADDDPLAELARIVGFEPKPVAANTQKREPTFTNIRPVDAREPSPEAVAAQPQHPIFNLEDELLREFELYDTPRNDNSAPDEAAERLDIVPESDNIHAEAKPERQEPRLDDAQPQPAAIADEPVSDVLDELREALASSPVTVEPEPRIADGASVEPVAAPQPPAVSERREPSFDEPAVEFDLASELEMAVGRVAEPEAPVAAQPVEPPKPAAPFRSLATNFSVQRAAASRPVEPVAEKPVAEAPKAAEPEPAIVEPVKAEPQFDDLAIEWDQLADDLQLNLSEPETVAEEAPVVAAAPAADDLLADVSRYPVPERPQAAPAVTLTPEAVTRFEKAQEPVAAPAEDEPAFDLDFGEFELELSQMSFDEPPPPAARAQAEVRPAAIPVAAPEPVREEAPAVAAAPEPPLAVLPEPDGDGELPFDPSLISDAEEHLEHVPHLDVPNLPAVEPEETIAPEPEYDLDIDAEMANLFAKSAEGEAAASKADAAHFDSGKAAIDEFDEFERALEEDFRRAMGEPAAAGDQAQPMILGPGMSYAGVEQPARRLPRKLIAGVALAVIAMAGVAGAYSYFFDADGAGGSTGPRVIAADKEPIKIVPENPGGKTVPNQDKAVYDRVAGNAAETPKQDSLLSSTEDPVDVVQRTLSPENLPLEGGADVAANMPTPVGETEDTRLLSSEGAREGGTSQAEATPAVSPRKVRTMIVKSDGTLVPRETVETPVAETPIKPALADPAQQKPTPAEDRIAQPESVEDAVAAAAQDNPPLRTVRTTKIESAPVPANRPADQPVNVVGTVTEQGNVKPAEAEAPQQVAAAAPGSYVMQVASVPSEADAKRAYDSLTKKFGSLLGGRGYEIRKAEIAGKGTFYRVRIPVGTKDEAAALCVKYRSAGGSCLITK